MAKITIGKSSEYTDLTTESIINYIERYAELCKTGAAELRNAGTAQDRQLLRTAAAALETAKNAIYYQVNGYHNIPK